MMQYHLEVKSPLYIGSGGTYSEAEYIVKDQEVWRIEINVLFPQFSQFQQRELIDSLENPNFKLADFLQCNHTPLDRAILYKVRYQGASPSNEIYEFIKTKRRPYLPGSSLKGAIRTAVLYALLGNRELEELGRILNDRNKRRLKRDVKQLLDRTFSRQSRKTANYDLLKFLQISDTAPLANLKIYSVKSLEVTETRTFGWYGRGKAPLELFQECMDVGAKCSGEFHLTYDSERHRSLNLQDRAQFLEESRLLEAIHTFSQDLIQYELGFAAKYHIPFLTRFYEQLARENSPKTPLLKLGGGAGFLATTVALKLKQDPALFEKVRQIKRGKSYRFEFPKTRRIAMGREMPLGWVKLVVS
jgi:CRISPR-associated protein Csm5